MTDPKKEILDLLANERTNYGKVLCSSHETDFIESVHGYTDWLACLIIKRGVDNPLPLTEVFTQLDAAVREICTRCGVNEAILMLVITKLHKLDKIPLVGKIENGSIIPDKLTLEVWKSQFAEDSDGG